jgi:hypothetical protein
MNEISNQTTKQLEEKGYSLMTYEGGLALPERMRNNENVNADGGLTLKGAIIFKKGLEKNLESIRGDAQITKNDSSYDVYALVKY